MHAFTLVLLLPLLVHGAPLGSAFVYQGRLHDSGLPANGNYDLRLVLFDVEEFGFPIGAIRTNANVAVSNGLFVTSIDFGAGAFAANARWLEIGVRTNGSGGTFTTLLPRQPLTPAPHSMFASVSGEAASLIAGTYSSAVVFDNGANSFSGAFTGNGSGLTTLNASRLSTGTVPEARLSANVARLSSNQTFSGANTFDPATGAPFAVGNATRIPNLNADLLDGLNSSAFALSAHHHDSAYWKLGGNAGLGAGQFLGTTDNQPVELRINGVAAIRLEPTIGSPNVIEGINSTGAGAVGATISGGSGHRVAAGTTNVSIGGGESNVVVLSSFGTITGGRLNLISNGWSSVIGGGESNSIRGSSPSFPPRYSVIGGGNNNLVEARRGTIGGGGFNEIGEIALSATISGGFSNRIMSYAESATIAGGFLNAIHSSSLESSLSSAIGGGSFNVISNADYSTIAGGVLNMISDRARYSFIAGGGANEIDHRASFSSIGGGSYNAIGSWSSNATICGGVSNNIGSNATSAVISGGDHNNVRPYSRFATISGGTHNTADGHIWDTIGGGFRNTMTNTEGSTISGGIGNAIQWPAGAFGAALRGNVIGGGEGNIIQGVRWSTIPGGEDNYVRGEYSFAAGRRAKALNHGAFIWADSQDADFASTDANEFAIRAAGGVRIQSERGIRLTAADRPLITRGWDPFASGNYVGVGRWGLFMEPSAITLGMPAIAAKKIRFAKYNADSTHTELGVIDQNGDLFLMGTVNPPSDRNVKTNFAAVNTRSVLERVLKLPIQTWSYTNNANVRHIGPVAQDFHAAFDVGADDKHISTIDADGVAFAAIQGLNRKLEERLQEKELQIESLQKRLNALERALSQPQISSR